MKSQAQRLAPFALVGLLATAVGATALNHGANEPPAASSASSVVSGGASVNWVVEPFTMDGDVEVLLLRVGMSKEALAASGVNAGQLQVLLSASDEASDGATPGASSVGALSSAPAQLAEFDAAFAEARVRRDALKRRVQSGLATEQEVADLQAAKAEFEVASERRDAFLEEVCAMLCGHAPEARRARLAQASRNKKWKNLPAKYLTAERTDHEWFQIKNALASKRTHEQLGEPVPEAATAFLSQLDSDPSVSAAAACCDSELAGIEATWAAIFGE